MTSSHQVPQWLDQATFYEIYPQSFADSNADGIGDIPGIIEHLDYLLQLGCNAIWLNPLYESPFRDAGYDISDYKKVAARYGTNDDLAALFAAAHARGMHVLLDLVPGHTSNEHPWFRQSATDSPNLYDDRYIWTGNWIEGGDGLPFIGGEEARDGAYIVNFFAFQPALNYGFAHPRKGWQAPALGDEALRTCDAMLDVMRFWLDMGADGFRVDMADSLVKGDDEGKPYTIRTWQYMLGQIRGEYPEAAFVSEWGRPDEAFEAGFDMDFYLDWRWDGVANGYSMLLRDTDTPMLRDGDHSYFNADSGTSIVPFLGEYEPRLEAARKAHAYFDLITCNHDTMRLVPRLTTRELALAYSTICLMPGVPFIYYGDEIGMRYRNLPGKEGGYTRTGSRTPMQWDNSANHGFSQAAADALYLPVDEREDAPTVAAAVADGNSLWHHMHAALEQRRSTPAFAPDADFSVLFAEEGRRPFVFKRAKDGVSAIVAVNPGRDGETVTLPDDDGSETRTITLNIGGAVLDGTTLTLPPQSFAVLQ
ncbi:alpha-amylase family glycosyl hydrolase [Bifidobacterium animalis]|uniref:alpha-amylase family glycosyl hydrolase n=1 Tax=Bifidobacterium animalis TaxID=28025 RepID=UPI003F8E0FC7